MSLSVDRLEQEAAVVAEVEALQDAAREPVLQIEQHRQAGRALAPRTALELVDLIAGLTPEQERQSLLFLGNEVDDKQLCPDRKPVGAVLDRHADQKARWVDR